MSRYLIRRIEETPADALKTRTEITALSGTDHLESVSWRDNESKNNETHNIRHVFVMTGATPNTRWLDGCVALDENGFIKTGPALSKEDLARRVGRSRVRLIYSKRVCREYSPSATFVAGTSSGSHRQLARDQSRSLSCTRYFRNSEDGGRYWD